MFLIICIIFLNTDFGSSPSDDLKKALRASLNRRVTAASVVEADEESGEEENEENTDEKYANTSEEEFQKKIDNDKVEEDQEEEENQVKRINKVSDKITIVAPSALAKKKLKKSATVPRDIILNHLSPNPKEIRPTLKAFHSPSLPATRKRMPTIKAAGISPSALSPVSQSEEEKEKKEEQHAPGSLVPGNGGINRPAPPVKRILSRGATEPLIKRVVTPISLPNPTPSPPVVLPSMLPDDDDEEEEEEGSAPLPGKL
jgi:hypothetical protein